MILVFIIVALLLFVVGYGLYLTFGPGKTDLRDPIDEHSTVSYTHLTLPTSDLV